MAEGPQVRLTAERLSRQLIGRRVVSCWTTRLTLSAFAESVAGAVVERVWCKGKHLAFAFSDGTYLHNQVLMRGRWRRIDGQLLFPPERAWLGLYVGAATVCNFGGQSMRVMDGEGLEAKLATLGPDLMADGLDRDDVMERLMSRSQPIGEVIMDQSVVSGVGNVAKSEALFLAGVDPTATANGLSGSVMRTLVDAMTTVLWESYRQGGRWSHRVYRRAGSPCPACGTIIARIIQGSARRSTYFCRNCQRQR